MIGWGIDKMYRHQSIFITLGNDADMETMPRHEHISDWLIVTDGSIRSDRSQ